MKSPLEGQGDVYDLGPDLLHMGLYFKNNAAVQSMNRFEDDCYFSFR